MKKLIYILCAAAALLTAFTGCQKNSGQENVKTIDLRYRANDSYDLPATDAPGFTILVASSDPWVIYSEHPDWCMISQEEGEAVNADSLHVGRAPITTVRVQYYDNTFLDDREDVITIQSEYWIGKQVTVRQKGIAFLTIADEDLDQEVIKAGGDYTIHINSNQNWTAKVTEGDWISISDGASGSKVGDVTLTASDNPQEMRYASVTIYDRHDVAMYVAKFTQDGVKLDPATFEMRTDFDQATVSLDIASNTKWTIVKESLGDDWFTLDKESGEGDDTVTITLTQNDDSGIRKANILLRNVVETAGDYQAEKTIVLKQAYKIEPVRTVASPDAIWGTGDWANPPVYKKDLNGIYFEAKSRMNTTMPFGTYTFHWSNLVSHPEQGGPRVRHWFCFGESAEMKMDIRPSDGKVSFDFNVAGDGNKPSIDGYTDVDWTAPVEVTYKFSPNGKTGIFKKDSEELQVEWCHITFLVNGNEAGSFDSASDMMRSVYMGASINMYLGCDTAGSAVLEWWDYTAPMNWDE